jgi:thiamine biosynthesis lipoprotein
MKRPPFSPRKTLILLAVFAVLVMWPYLRSAREPRRYEFGGATMGTTYSVKLGPSHLSERKARELQADVEKLLADITRQMSTYDPTTDISRFNAHTGTEAVTVGRMLVEVTGAALTMAAQSGGAFDPTIKPLVECWGFYRQDPTDAHRPDPATIAAALSHIGHNALAIAGQESLSKALPEIQLDLNAIAPGYAVDRIVDLAAQKGFAHVFVDVGGEIRARGQSAPDQPWRVSVDVPALDSLPGSGEFMRLDLRDVAIATSGDYRHYFEEDGRIYSHILDPRTGYPVSNRVTSASVLAPTCMQADACATTLMVLGPDEGLHMLARMPGIEAMLILREPDGHFTRRATPGFPTAATNP